MRRFSAHQAPASLTRALRARRGSAIILVMLTTVGLAALALSAIFMSSSAVLMTKYYDKERDFRYAAEQALQLGLSELQQDTALHLPDSGYVTLMSNAQLMDAYGTPIPTVRVNLYAGQTGTNTGQFGEFASLVAQAQDSLGNTRYVRRLELEEDNFARFAMFTNQFSGGLCYGPGEFIKGVGMSNQIWQSCGNPTTTTPFPPTGRSISSAVRSPTYMAGNKRASRSSRCRRWPSSRPCQTTPRTPTSASRRFQGHADRVRRDQHESRRRPTRRRRMPTKASSACSTTRRATTPVRALRVRHRPRVRVLQRLVHGEQLGRLQRPVRRLAHGGRPRDVLPRRRAQPDLVQVGRSTPATITQPWARGHDSHDVDRSESRDDHGAHDAAAGPLLSGWRPAPGRGGAEHGLRLRGDRHGEGRRGLDLHGRSTAAGTGRRGPARCRAWPHTGRDLRHAVHWQHIRTARRGSTRRRRRTSSRCIAATTPTPRA